MTDAHAFLTSDSVRAYLARAAEAAAMPVAVHVHTPGGESRAFSHGPCTACARVAKVPGGRDACHASRLPAAQASLRRNRPVPFVCHMGFACVACPAVADGGAAMVLTLGPYGPTMAPDALDLDAQAGWRRLGQVAATVPPLDDIRRMPPPAVAALAEWTRDGLTPLWDAWRRPPEQPEPALPLAPSPATRRRGKSRTPRRVEPFDAAVLAAAVAAGDRKRIRTVVAAGLADAGDPAVLRQRATAVMAAALEACARLGFDIAPAEAKWADATAHWPADRTPATAARAVCRSLGALVRPVQRNGFDPGIRAIHDAVAARLPEPVPLDAVARELGLHPTAVTQRLKRKLGMPFTAYVARLRVDRAKTLLLDTRLTVSDVARRVGIDDVSNFGKVFRRFEGESPGQYRRRVREGSAHVG